MNDEVIEVSDDEDVVDLTPQLGNTNPTQSGGGGDGTGCSTASLSDPIRSTIAQAAEQAKARISEVKKKTLSKNSYKGSGQNTNNNQNQNQQPPVSAQNQRPKIITGRVMLLGKDAIRQDFLKKSNSDCTNSFFGKA